jgi:hypothetical protein
MEGDAMEPYEGLKSRIDDLVEATTETAQAERLAAGRLQELVDRVSVLAGVAEDWRTHSYGGEAPEQLREIGQALDKIADAAATAGTQDGDPLQKIAIALDKIADAVPSQQKDIDPERTVVYENARKLAARIRYRTEPGERPTPTDPLPAPTLRQQDPIGRLDRQDGTFESSATAKFGPRDTVAIYGAGLDHVTNVQLGGMPVTIDDKTDDYLFFEVPQAMKGGVVRLEFEVDGKKKPAWTTQLTVA